MAVGVPDLLAVRAQFFALPRLQVGFGYTFIPQNNVLGKEVELEAQSIALGDGRDYTLTPSVTPTAIAVSPFLRYFPNDEDNFYFQLDYHLIRVSAKVTSEIEDPELNIKLDGAVIAGNVQLTQALPTLSIGHVFRGEIYFFNISLGVSWLASLSTDVTLTGALPDQVGGTEPNQAAIDTIKNQLQQQANRQVAEARKSLSLLPSITLSFGFQL